MGSMESNVLQGVQDAGTVLIADTAEFNQIARFKPAEGTTNPSLLYQAAQRPEFSDLVSRTIDYAKTSTPTGDSSAVLECAAECLAVRFGTEIVKLTGRVSTEVDVVHSFDPQETVRAARRIIKLYAAHGVPKESVRIKISATWEGIQAARILERDHGVSVLVTIVFGMAQAIAAAEAGVTCIAPYVGRIGDWHRAHGYQGDSDMGVQTVQQMQNYLRKHGYRTKVMGASFRSVEQVKALAGVDLLTIAPAILEQMEARMEAVVPQLTRASAQAMAVAQVSYINSESAFRWAMNADACATEKSAEAMRRFAEDNEKLKAMLSKRL